MPKEVQLRFDYDALDAQTRDFVLERAERIHELARRTAEGIVRIGQHLTEVKARLGHGKFLEWIEREFAWKHDTVTRFMNVHEQFKLRNLRNLEIDVSALYLIAAPSTPEPVRVEVMRRAENGEAVTHEAAQIIRHEFRQNGAIPPITKSLPQLIAERRRLIPSGEVPTASPAVKLTAEERRLEAEERQQREASSARYVQLMEFVVAIETIADSKKSMAEVAAHIERFDTPDQDWRGECREAFSRLRALCKELKL